MTTARTLITAPTEDPVSVLDARTHCRVTGVHDDALLSSLVKAATEHAETFTERRFVTQTWEVKLDCFPDEIFLPYPPLSSVVEIRYIDTDGVEQTLSSSVYTVDTDSTPGRVYLAYDQSWPTIRSQPHAVTVKFIAGYGGASAVPHTIKAAIKLLVGHLYENREAVALDASAVVLPMAVESLLSGEKVPEAA